MQVGTYRDCRLGGLDLFTDTLENSVESWLEALSHLLAINGPKTRLLSVTHEHATVATHKDT